MSQENFNFLRDLEQIAEAQRLNAAALEELGKAQPADIAEDLSELREKALKIASEVE